MTRVSLVLAATVLAVGLGGCPDDLDVCLPACEGRECGPDGCGGNCGPACGQGWVCDDEGMCIACEPNCADKSCCDEDGCGGNCADALCLVDQVCDPSGCECCDCLIGESCLLAEQSPTNDCRICDPDGSGGREGISLEAGTCLISDACYDDDDRRQYNTCYACSPQENNTDWTLLNDGRECDGGAGRCHDGHCCTPDCDDKACGSDGCGGLCPPGCSVGQVCSPGGICEDCVSDCNERQCGSDGCGGTCGDRCGPGQVCQAGQCVAGTELWVDCRRQPADCPDAAGTQAEPYCTITEALAAANPGVTIHVAAGLCVEQVLVDLPYLQLVGAPGPATQIRNAASPVLEVSGVGGVLVQDIVVEMAGAKGIALSQAADSALVGVVVRQAGLPTEDADRKGIALTDGAPSLTDVEVGPIGSTAAGSEVTGIKLDSTHGAFLESCAVHGLMGGDGGRVIGILASTTTGGMLEGCEVWNLDASGQPEIRGVSLFASTAWRMEHSSVHDLNPSACQVNNTCTVIGVAVVDADGFSTYRNEISHLGPEGANRILGYWLAATGAASATLRNDLIHDLASAMEEPCNTCGIRIDGEQQADIGNPTIARIGVGSQSVHDTGIYAPNSPLQSSVRNAILSDIKGYGLRAATAATLQCAYASFSQCSSGRWYGTSCADYLQGDSDPQFVDANGADFRLQSSSPCIDAGDPLWSCDQEPACPINLGAYGNTDEAAPRE